jgi:hypothetical protein
VNYKPYFRNPHPYQNDSELRKKKNTDSHRRLFRPNPLSSDGCTLFNFVAFEGRLNLEPGEPNLERLSLLKAIPRVVLSEVVQVWHWSKLGHFTLRFHDWTIYIDPFPRIQVIHVFE